MEFFKVRYRSNLQNLQPMSPERRYQRAQVGFVVWLCLAVMWLILAAAGGQLYGWAGVAGAGVAALDMLRVMRNAHRE